MALRNIILQGLLFISIGLSAHSPDVSSTLLVEESEGEWIFQVRAALTAFEYEIENKYGALSYSSPEEFQDLVIKHILENIIITANNADVSLQNGMVKLGHETSATFNVKGIPRTLEVLRVTNSSFSNISRNQSALIVLKKDYAKNQFKLDQSNEHTAHLKINNLSFELATADALKAEFPFGVLAIFIFGSTFLIILYKWFYKNTNKI